MRGVRVLLCACLTSWWCYWTTKYVVKYALMTVVYVFYSSIHSIVRWLWCILQFMSIVCNTSAHFYIATVSCHRHKPDMDQPWPLHSSLCDAFHLDWPLWRCNSVIWLHAKDSPVISSEELCNCINKRRQLSQRLCVMRKTTYQQQVHFPFCLLGVLQYIYSWCPRFLVLPLKHKFTSVYLSQSFIPSCLAAFWAHPWPAE